MKAWQLQNVDNIEHTPDTSGIYVLINYQIQTDNVRLDIMSDKNEPIQSFAGTSDNVRKHACRWMMENVQSNNRIVSVSLEHAAYIGSELLKAEIMAIDYVQDGELKLTFNKSDAALLKEYAEHNKSKAENILKRYEQ